MRLFTKGFAAGLFKWIFAVIAGALVLVFLIGFAFQQQRTADTLDDRKLVLRLENQLEALGIADVASKTLHLGGEGTLHFFCEGIQSGTFRKSTPKIIFASPTLTGELLHTWITHWRFPFMADTFYYVSNKHVRVLLLYDAASFSYVGGLDVPRTFNTQLMDIADFDPPQLLGSMQGLDAVSLVFFTPVKDVAGIFRQFPRVPLTIIEVDPVTHAVAIYTRDTTENTYYLGESMLYGLFYAPEQYSCIKDRALDHFKDVVTVYEQKTNLLISKLGSQPTCQDLLIEGRRLLTQYKTLQDKEQYYTYAAALEQQNRNLVKHDCPTIY